MSRRTLSLPRPWFVALGLSVAVHALTLGVLCWVSRGDPAPMRQVFVGSIVLLDGPTRPGPQPPPVAPGESASGDAEEQEGHPGVFPVLADPVEPGPPVPAPVQGGSAAATTGNTREGPGAAGGGQGAGGSGTASFFGVPVQGQRIVYLIDRSSSMGLSGCLRAAKGELLACLRQLPASSRFQVLLYNEAAVPLLGRPGEFLTPGDETLSRVTAALDGVRALAGTDYRQPLRQALDLQADVLFLVTDADGLTPELVRSLTGLNGGRSVIHTLELTTHRGRSGGGPLELLARQNGGTYHAVLVSDE
jgi:von Willebrand factor type A domain